MNITLEDLEDVLHEPGTIKRPKNWHHRTEAKHEERADCNCAYCVAERKRKHKAALERAAKRERELNPNPRYQPKPVFQPVGVLCLVHRTTCDHCAHQEQMTASSWLRDEGDSREQVTASTNWAAYPPLPTKHIYRDERVPVCRVCVSSMAGRSKAA